jgi:hypothetical protein
MLRDVFYYGKKPNAHPREQHATDLADARQKSTTEHFWIIDGLCDYRNFDWDFDFEFLPDEDVWAQEHNNVWPSQHQKDSGTWLCNTDNTEALTIYRGDVDPVIRRKEKSDAWVILDLIDETKFDLSWHPDPTDPPYIYKWGSKFIPVQIQACLEYHTPNATQVKYMDQNAELLPNIDCWKEYYSIDKTSFDFTWRPDPREPAYIYVWGNKYVPAEIQATLEYHVPGATEYKYMPALLTLLPTTEHWVTHEDIVDFDYSWIPDPREPDYIYQWGNKHYGSDLKPTVEYVTPGATQIKHMSQDVTLKPTDKWVEHCLIDKNKFDMSWRPNPTSPPYIYVWGNKYEPAEIKPTLEYIVPGAIEKKYMGDISVEPEYERWNEYIKVSVEFDKAWRPDPREPAYIYAWGNKYDPAEVKPTLTYTVPGATEFKYMDIVNLEPEWDRWKEHILVDRNSFDFSWRPDPNLHEPPYIYVWGNKFHPAEQKPTVEYHVPGATEYKYMGIVDLAPEWDRWNIIVPIDMNSFDFRWRPDPNLHEPPMVYVFGNKWNDSTTEPTLEYIVPGAAVKKYMDYPLAIPKIDMSLWTVSNKDDLESFDFSWRPNPHSPPQIYQWADNGPRYTVSDATEVVLMERTENVQKAVVNRYKIKTTLEELIMEHQDEVFWAINPDLSYSRFDFNWRPNEENFRHVNVFGNEYSKNTQTYYVNGPLYMMGHKELNYVDDQTVEIDSNLSMFFVDKNNSESQQRFDLLKQRYPQIQKTRYLNSWVDTINRCINKSETELCWILNSELDYTDFVFDYYPSPWQQKMVHVFGTQWSHWGTTFMVNKESFPEDTKYVKIIEHLNNLNFVKSKRAVASNCLYDVYLIDYGNDSKDNITSLLENKTKKNVYTIEYAGDYLATLKNMLYELGIKKDHYIWVCSSICDYTNFDFTYVCDPFSLEQLHVFPSDKQKYGDTFFINVNRLRSLVEDLDSLENIDKINFNQHQRVNRLPAPSFITESDTHVSVTNTDFDWPYATFITADNKEIKVVENEPISLWSKESKNILITSIGGTRIVVPKEAKEYVKNELYDYPYIAKSNKLATSQPLDIVFLSNGETGADENYEHLLNVTKGLPNRVVRVDGINGRVQAYHAAAEASNTPWMFTVFAKLRINSKFDFSWQPDRLQVPKHYIFYASNPVNGLVYGHQAMIAYNKKITLGNIGKGLDFTLDSEHEVVELNSGVARYNTDEFSTWRTSFREAIKLKLDDNPVSRDRLKTWTTVGVGDFAQYSIQGAKDAVEYVEQVNGDIDKLKLSYEWAWLRDRFNK